MLLAAAARTGTETALGVGLGPVREPLVSVVVSALREAYSQGTCSLSTYSTVETNDLGEYRLFSLEPGRYFVSADVSGQASNTSPTSDPFVRGGILGSIPNVFHGFEWQEDLVNPLGALGNQSENCWRRSATVIQPVKSQPGMS